MTCPSSLLLSQAMSSGVPAELQAHLLTCPTCAAQWRALAQARAAVQELPYVIPDRGRRDEVRKRLLAAAASLPVPTYPRPLSHWLAAASIAAAALCVILGAGFLTERAHPRQAASHFRAAVQSQGASRFVHERTGDDEWVRLSDGTLIVEVQPLQAGERFRVLCGDAEVEVRGTAFETVVERDHLLRVYVLHGRVEVIPYSGPRALLRAGERWQASGMLSRPGNSATQSAATSTAKPALFPAESLPTIPSAASVPADTPASASASAPAVNPGGIADAPESPARPLSRMRHAAPPASSRVPKASAIAHPVIARAAGEQVLPAPLTKPASSPAELAFLDGWTALRQGRHQAAATAFGRAADQSDGNASASLLEDARFWRAVALARAGQRQPAVAALRDFLSHHPSAVRFGEASALLGWQLLREGQLDAAQRCFESAEKDSHAPVRDNARAGLAAVAARR